MQLKKGMYVYDQIVFGLLGIHHMLDEKVIKEAFQKDDLEKVFTILEESADPDHKEILEFIFKELFSTEENMDRIRQVDEEIDTVDVDEFLYSYRYRTTPEIGAEYTNGSVERIASEILAQGRPDRVLDICCGQGVFLAEAIRQNIAKEYSGIEINKEMAIISRIKFLILEKKPSNIEVDDIFARKYEGSTLPQYDATFCHMPMGMKLDANTLAQSGLHDTYTAEKISKRDSEWAFIRAMQRLTKKGGRSVALVRTGLLFTEAGKEYRRELVESGKLEAIILLPTNILRSTSVQTALIVLSSNNNFVRMVDATDYFQKGRRFNYIPDGDLYVMLDLYFTGGENIPYREDEKPTKECDDISRERIAENDYSLEPRRYLFNGAASYDNAVKLGDVTTNIFRGTQIKADDHDTMMELYGNMPDCYLLNLSNISNGYIDDNLEEVNVDDPGRLKRYMIEQEDVVISARGTKISVAVADNVQGRDIIATGNLIVIRCGDALNPYYLKAFLESDAGMNALKTVQTGSAIFAINPRQVKEIMIELLDIKKQEEIGQKAKWMIEELRESHRRIKTVNEKLSHLFEESREV